MKRPDLDAAFLTADDSEVQAAMAAAVSRYARHHRAEIEAANGPGPVTMIICVALLAAAIALVGAA